MSSMPMTSRNSIPMASYWKLCSVGDVRRDHMTDMDDARLEAALSLRKIVGCYLKFAKEAGNPTIWGARLQLAAKLEKEAAALEAASNQHR
jgi:hypothetical protein